MRSLVTVLLWTACACFVACDDGGGVRPDVDIEPYGDSCNAPAECPTPYECVLESAGHSGMMMCLSPCNSDGDCPIGFFCNGVDQQADIGALDYCVENV